MIKKTLTLFRRKVVADERGAALMISYFVLAILFTLMGAFALSTVQEVTDASHYRDSVAAFWLAEAGVTQYLQDPNILDGGDVTINYGLQSVLLTKDDSGGSERIVTARGLVNDTARSVETAFPVNPPALFDNTMSTGGNISLLGFIAKLEVFGPTRLTGTFTKSGFGASGWFEDKQEGVASSSTTFTYPDSDVSGTPDEFNDFVQFNRDLVSTYPSEEVVYIQSDSTHLIYPGSGLSGKKVVFVEGSTPGAGDVDVIFDAGWQAEQNLTIITTGSVDYVQPLQLSSDSQLNIITWQGYEEASILYSAHNGVTYSHEDASFYSIFEYSETTGNLIANTGIAANEALSWKRFLYGSPLTEGNVPPGFEGLLSQGPGGYSSTPSSWKEM